ncbi:MAG: ATP-dependent helicase [Bacteroidales bacterium]|nr:ATP-dependent helicase [Bacteroidales bacterium]
MADQFIPHPAQQEAIDFIGGRAMVLAPPGCGKTDVLSRRIVKARRDYGVPYKQMLCLTFTNRASRNMRERVEQTLGESPEDLFVGNIHRFCARFLIENELVPPGAALIDELDQEEILKTIAPQILSDPNLRYDADIPSVASWLWRARKGFPEALNRQPHFSFKMRDPALRHRLEDIAALYIDYKEEHRLLDFDDLLNHAYYHMELPGYKRLKYSDYAWIEVDEVQDLNPLQMAIIGKLTNSQGTLVCFGDERQSIFSFIGARADNITKLSQGMRIINFDTNFRSPRALVNFLNSYAVANFGIEDKQGLMVSSASEDGEPIELYQVEDRYQETEMIVSALARQLSTFHPDETVAVLGRTNKMLDVISEMLEAHKVNHMKLSRKDLFKRVDFKTVVSHFAVMADAQSWTEWERLLYQSKSASTMGHAVELTHALRNYGLTGEDLVRDNVPNLGPALNKTAKKFSQQYGDKYYAHTLQLLQQPVLTAQALVAEMDWVYKEMVADRWIKPVKRWPYVKTLLEKTLLRNAEGSPAELLKQAVYEVRTYNEGDFYDNGIVQEHVHLMTVHKAKGLQFDRVVVAKAEDFPNWMERTSEWGRAESARLLYVAMSRARKQLCLIYANHLSPYLKSLTSQMQEIDRPKIDLILQIEKMYSPQDM